MPRYRVIAEVGISVSTIVEADSPEEAKEMAEERSLQSLAASHHTGANDEEEWCHSGELDGTPFDLTVEEEIPE